jgi:four helix bundle protein
MVRPKPSDAGNPVFSIFKECAITGPIFSQLQRASLSVQLNIAEGYAFGESPTFRRHLAIAYGSAIETGELLEVALDSRVIPKNPGNHLLHRNQRSQRLLLGMLRKMRGS